MPAPQTGVRGKNQLRHWDLINPSSLVKYRESPLNYRQIGYDQSVDQGEEPESRCLT
mgnify:CR=1 FL=1|jgi:hypothetical protein